MTKYVVCSLPLNKSAKGTWKDQYAIIVHTLSLHTLTFWRTVYENVCTAFKNGSFTLCLDGTMASHIMHYSFKFNETTVKNLLLVNL